MEYLRSVCLVGTKCGEGQRGANRDLNGSPGRRFLSYRVSRSGLVLRWDGMVPVSDTDELRLRRLNLGVIGPNESLGILG